MKTLLTALFGIALAINAAAAFAIKNYHDTVGWSISLVLFIWLVVEIRKEKVIISFEFENEKK